MHFGKVQFSVKKRMVVIRLQMKKNKNRKKMGQNCLHFVGESNKHRNLLHFGKGVYPFYRIIPLVCSSENVNVNERKL